MDFKNEKQLENFLLRKCRAAIAKTESEIYSVIKSTLAEFYGEFSPEEYIRTNQLLNSLVKTDVKRVDNGYEAEVYFDVGMLDYQTGLIKIQSTEATGRMGHATWSGEKVLDVTMTDGLPHGRYADGTPIWTTSMKILGDIKERLKQNLIAQGIPIR